MFIERKGKRRSELYTIEYKGWLLYRSKGGVCHGRNPKRVKGDRREGERRKCLHVGVKICGDRLMNQSA